MSNDHPLTLTVEQAGQVLGVGRSTAYELVRSGDLKCLRLRRRIVVPIAHVADKLGVTARDVWRVVNHPPGAAAGPESSDPAVQEESLTLFSDLPASGSADRP